MGMHSPSYSGTRAFAPTLPYHGVVTFGFYGLKKIEIEQLA